MEAKAQSMLIVAGIKYHLDKALALSKTMPVLEMKTVEFLPFEQAQVATIEPADAKLNHGEIVLYKREGKWIIITGRESVRRAVETGAAGFGARLLSAQALKRCKVDSFVHPDEGKPLPPPEHTHDSSYGQSRSQQPHYPRSTKSGPGDQFRNAPRIVDNRQPTYGNTRSNPSVMVKDVRTATQKIPNHSLSGSVAPRYDSVQERGQRTQFGVKKTRTQQR